MITISFDNNTNDAKDLSDKDFSDFYLEDGIDLGKTASLMLRNIDTALGATGFAKRIMKVEATRLGDWANSLSLKLSKIGDDNIKLEGMGRQLIGTLTIKSSDTSKVLDDLITITIDQIADENAISATEDAILLKGGTATEKASIKLETIDTALKATGFAKRIMKVEANKVGDWANSLDVALSKIDNDNIKLVVFQSAFEISSTTKKLILHDIGISIEDETDDNKSNAVDATLESNTLKGGEGPNNSDSSKLIIGDYSRADSDTPGNRKGLTAFKEIEDISIVYAPNAYEVQGDLVDELISHCELQVPFCNSRCPTGIFRSFFH